MHHSTVRKNFLVMER